MGMVRVLVFWRWWLLMGGLSKKGLILNIMDKYSGLNDSLIGRVSSGLTGYWN